ncbi:MAG TPA: UvrD-helicase domain-containing protein [Bacteroidales bacterium]|nr:UvrD-helicase domain-containing protein [Bacteroidales bacterium]
MIIKDDHIREAENLLINGIRFDGEERIPFIKNLNSCDLLAVPGSGKTTALLAKLYCISKHLPFNDGSGVLVLSHTNAAVDEIKNNLKKICPNLFGYPNFIGTIQSFVNKFLANHACLIKYGSYIAINDNDVFEREADKFFNSLPWKKTEPKGLKNKLLGKLNIGKGDIGFDEKVENIKKFLKYFELNIIDRKVIYNESSFYTYCGSSQAYYLELEGWRESLFKKGILNYKDSFSLGEWFLENYPEIKAFLKKRFKFIFIDEMQDLEKFQIDIIDKIFYEECSPSIMQRIGDINQSIYSSGKRVKVKADWVPRNQLYLKGSNRLTSEIANIVNFFTLDRQVDEEGHPRFVVYGLRQLKSEIKPHILLFDYDSMDSLQEKFKELIMRFSLPETSEAKKYGFKIIGWNAKWDDDDHGGKLRLEDIFDSYKKELKANKESYDSLSKYLQLFDYEKTTLEAARKAVLNALIHVLRIEGKTYLVRIRGNEVSRYFSKDELIKFIKSPENNCDYELFKKLIYVCANRLTIKREYDIVYNFLKKFITSKFKTWFNLTINQETQSFIGNEFEEIVITSNASATEADSDNEIKIDIGTVHSAKGQTHCATMYVETSYFDYETNKLKVVSKKATSTSPEEYLPYPLLGQEHSYRPQKDSRAKEALKMMYVGFSRPTHLLCFACLKENITDIDCYGDAGWEVIDLTKR